MLPSSAPSPHRRKDESSGTNIDDATSIETHTSTHNIYPDTTPYANDQIHALPQHLRLSLNESNTHSMSARSIVKSSTFSLNLSVARARLTSSAEIFFLLFRNALLRSIWSTSRFRSMPKSCATVTILPSRSEYAKRLSRDTRYTAPMQMSFGWAY